MPGVRKALELDPLDANDSLELFEEIRLLYQPCANLLEEREATRILLTSLGGLALAIEQIAAYIAFRALTIEQFQSKYRRMAKQIHGKNDATNEALGGWTLATVWSIHFETIQETNAAKLLGLMSLMSAEGIPIETFLPEDTSALRPFTDFCKDEAE